MRRKIVILFVAAFASILGAAACSGEAQVEAPDEVPVKVQDGGEQQKEQPQQQQKQQDQQEEKQGAEGKVGVDTK
jgi:hypothetical protein